MRIRKTAYNIGGMRTALDLYLASPNVTATSLAEKCGCSVSTITRIRDGEFTPNLDLAKKIVDATGGRVRFEDLISHG